MELVPRNIPCRWNVLVNQLSYGSLPAFTGVVFKTVVTACGGAAKDTPLAETAGAASCYVIPWNADILLCCVWRLSSVSSVKRGFS